jgi:peptidoglycan biosynthesis protein MviN/MurJ (putative lipid II flippase)
LLSSVLAIYALQFPLDALTRVFQSFWYSRLDTRVPFINVALGVGADIALASLLVWPFGVQGIALAYVLSSIANLVHGYVTVNRRIRVPPSALLRLLAKVVIASGLAGAAALVTAGLLPHSPVLLRRLLAVAVPGVVGSAVLVIALAGLRVRIWALVRRRDHSSPP